jgi:hypothetical protein
MIKLGGLVLSDHLVWAGEFDQRCASASAEIALNGDEIYFVQPLNKGRNIDLEAETPHFTREQIDALILMANAVMATWLLAFHGVIMTVRFRQEDSPAIDITPAPSRPNYIATDRYAGKIKLKEV